MSEAGRPSKEVVIPYIAGQSGPAARTAHMLSFAAQELWDIATYTDTAQMYEDARRVASSILASCPLE